MTFGVGSSMQGDEAPVSLADVCEGLGLRAAVVEQLGVLWGKSAERAGGRTHLLLAHMLDTAMVAEQMWLHFLAPRTRAMLDRTADGDGMRLFMWLCGVHDWGKATPAFQSQHTELAAAVRAAGLVWNERRLRALRFWRHDHAGAVLSREMLGSVWSAQHVAWVWPLIGGHHGRVPAKASFGEREARGEPQGLWASSPWPQAQHAVLAVFTRALGYEEPSSAQPAVRPSKADQLAVAGLVIMADWIASDEEHFPGLDVLSEVSVATSRKRAADAWTGLGLRGGWGEIAVPRFDPISVRFGESPRDSQRVVIETVRAMTGPGLVFVEAPMGEGKTKAALAAAEVLAARFGCGGLFVGMPTQATSGPMYSGVRRWAVAAFGEQVAEQAVLLHGKRAFNSEWKQLAKRAGSKPDALYRGVDEFGEPLGAFDADDPCCGAERFAPADWFLGSKRGLLAGLTVGTIDQLLYAATRTKHVMLRFAGLAGKVVILDEVHAADIYMQQFLLEALFLLGQVGAPVVLLSATLPPGQRKDLADAYLKGALNIANVAAELPAPAGYPRITAVWVDPETSAPCTSVRDCTPWRVPFGVKVELLPDTGPEPAKAVEVVKERLADGGVALVIHNTVERAQFAYRELKAVFGDEVELLHGRLDVADRAERTERSVKLLGPPNSEFRRPERRIVVATQVAEQSFDIDADLLVTDVAPVDLLLQRVGRLHRHDRAKRPSRLATPTVVVTGLEIQADGPAFEGGSEAIYGKSWLIRTAAQLETADGGAWMIPTQIPDLVADVYGEVPQVPPAWLAEAEAQDEQWRAKQDTRSGEAQKYALLPHRNWTKPTLDALHYGSTELQGDIEFEAVVRDGRKTVEVVLVRRGEDGIYAAIDGTRIGATGEGALTESVQDAVLGGMVRLPARLTDAVRDLGPLPGWSSDPLLRYARALVLGPDGVADLGDHRVSYDGDLGLVVETTGTGLPR